jgi:tetratricopeptide (TPR) repeat protein
MPRGDESEANDFYSRQARENAAPGGKLPKTILLGVLVIGVLFGAYQLTMFIVNFDKNQAIRNVAVNLAKPELFDGVAKVDVTINNMNPQTISDITFKYEIIGPGGDTAASGTAHIPEMVPIGAERRFQHVTLGPLTASAARMKTDLVDLKLGPKANLTAEQYNKFVDAAGMKDEEQVQGFTDFVKSAPDFSAGYVCLGKAYEAAGDDAKAEEAYNHAIKLDPKNADAHYSLGLVYLAQKKRDQAEKEVSTAYDLAPNDPDIQKTIQDNRQ